MIKHNACWTQTHPSSDPSYVPSYKKPPFHWGFPNCLPRNTIPFAAAEGWVSRAGGDGEGMRPRATWSEEIIWKIVLNQMEKPVFMIPNM